MKLVGRLSNFKSRYAILANDGENLDETLQNYHDARLEEHSESVTIEGRFVVASTSRVLGSNGDDVWSGKTPCRITIEIDEA